MEKQERVVCQPESRQEKNQQMCPCVSRLCEEYVSDCGAEKSIEAVYFHAHGLEPPDIGGDQEQHGSQGNGKPRQ